MAWLIEVCNHFNQIPSVYMESVTLKKLRFDHMCYLQTLLAKTNADLNAVERHGGDHTTGQLRELGDRQKHLRELITNHG